MLKLVIVLAVLMQSTVDKMPGLIIGRALRSLVSKREAFDGLFCCHFCSPDY